jgi:hypothetical protein
MDSSVRPFAGSHVEVLSRPQLQLNDNSANDYGSFRGGGWIVMTTAQLFRMKN